MDSQSLSIERGSPGPYLSVVVTTRNDNHGVDLLRRTQIFLDGLAAQANRHGVDTELIVVEWNPPADRPRLADVLRWPGGREHFEARIIVVSETIHRRLAHSDQLPLFQMIAKNVGIRRSRGRFVVATNIDLLFSDELMQFLAQGRLRDDAYYRADRYDADSDVPVDAPVEEQLAWCDGNLLRICRRDGTLDVKTGDFYRIYENMRVPLWFAPWLRIFRYIRRSISAYIRSLLHIRDLRVPSAIRVLWRFGWRLLRLTWQAALLTAIIALSVLRRGTRRAAGKVASASARGRRSTLLTLAEPVVRLDEWLEDAVVSLRLLAGHSLRDEDRRDPRLMRLRRRLRRARRLLLRAAARRLHVTFPRPVVKSPAEVMAEMRSLVSLSWIAFRLVLVSERARMRLHTNACGDFTLASRDAWLRVGGYPELELFSMHLDSLFLYQAHYSGVRERLLPYRIYHIEHDHGFRPDSVSLATLNARLERAAIPQISNEDFLEWVSEMYRTKKPKFANREDWGFAAEPLEDRYVVTRTESRHAETRPEVTIRA